jgi:hypothetical protein
MAANTAPIWTGTPQRSSVAITAANTRSDGNGTIATDIFLAATLGSNGSFVESIEFMPTATTANTSTTATVARIFVSTQTSGSTSSANTWLLRELALPSVTAASSSGMNPTFVVPIGRALKAGETILVTNHAAPASNTAWIANVFFGNY